MGIWKEGSSIYCDKAPLNGNKHHLVVSVDVDEQREPLGVPSGMTYHALGFHHASSGIRVGLTVGGLEGGEVGARVGGVVGGEVGGIVGAGVGFLVQKLR